MIERPLSDEEFARVKLENRELRARNAKLEAVAEAAERYFDSARSGLPTSERLANYEAARKAVRALREGEA